MSESSLNKADLVDQLCNDYSIERARAREVVEQFFSIVLEQLTEGNVVKLPGLGNFSVRDKKPRPGRNLQTGEVVMIEARRVVKFQPSGTLVERITSNLVGEK